MSLILRLLFLLIIAATVGGFAYIATTDIPVAQETVTKKVNIE